MRELKEKVCRTGNQTSGTLGKAGGVRKTFKTSKIGLYGFSKKYVLLKDILFLLYMVTESLQRKYKNRVDFSQCCLLFPLSFSESICNTIKGEGVCLGVK